jgi:hypothetical protein
VFTGRHQGSTTAAVHLALCRVAVSQGYVKDDLNLLEEFKTHPEARLAIKECT